MKQRAAILLSFLVASFSAFGQMTSNDVATVIAQALTRANEVATNNGVVAVVDREGFVLGVWSLATNPPPLDVFDAVTKAGTGVFLSSDQHAFTSRTAGFIVQQNFPPGIKNRSTGPLVGVNFSSMTFSDVNYFKDPRGYDPLAYGGGGTNGTPVVPRPLSAISGLAGSPGGVPLYKNGKLIGGVGAVITGHPPIPALADIQTTAKQRYDVDEDVALAGQVGFEPANEILGTHVFINGIRVPYVQGKTSLTAVVPLGSIGLPFPPYDITNSPPVNYPTNTLGGVLGEVRAPIIDDPQPGLVNGQLRLTATEVTNILTLAAQRAIITRAGIRLPRGQSARVFISVVNNPNSSGVAPAILGTFRVGEGTVFSWDVSVQKARTALFFSSPLAVGILPPELTGKALSARTIGFIAQSLYPPSIAKKPPGPLLGLQELYSLLPLATPLLPSGAVTNTLNGVFFTTNDLPCDVNPNLPNGITIFPGGFPLYRNGVLIGAIGVSGDGVDQDDIIAASGTVNFPAPEAIRADKIIYRGTRLPYAKFPRNPSL